MDYVVRQGPRWPHGRPRIVIVPTPAHALRVVDDWETAHPKPKCVVHERNQVTAETHLLYRSELMWLAVLEQEEGRVRRDNLIGYPTPRLSLKKYLAWKNGKITYPQLRDQLLRTGRS